MRLDGDDPAIELPAERVKNARAHAVPLAPAAASMLAALPRVRMSRKVDSPFVFTTTGSTAVSGWSGAEARLDAMVAALAAREAERDRRKPVVVGGWRTHDLRRTAATRMAELGVPPHVVEALLNHVSGFRAGVAGTYNRAVYAGPKREAAELWAKHVLSL